MSVAITLVGHSCSVWGSSFTLNGSHIATCSSDETVRVWAVESGECVGTLGYHKGVVRGCKFSPDSTLLGSCSWDKNVVVVRSADFQPVYNLTGHTYGVTHIQFSPSGTLLASSSWDNNIGLWDMHTGQLVDMLRGHMSPVAACSFVIGGSVLASCSWDGTVRVWDLSAPRNPIVLEGHPDAVYDISCSPSDPNLIATCGRKGTLLLWDLKTRAPWQMLQKGWKETNSVSFSPSGAQIATGNNLCELHLWDMNLIKSSSLANVNPTVLHAHGGAVVDCSYSSDGRWLATCSSDHTCKIWDLTRPSDAAVTQLADTLAGGLSLKPD